MKKAILSILLVAPALSFAAPAVSSDIVVQENKALLTVAAALKGSANLGLGGLALSGNVEAPNAASINANSIKVRGGSVDGKMIMLKNDAGISAALGASGNVNSVDINTAQ